MRRIDWVVYAKKPFGGPAQVLAYLGRYTHRVAIANSRIKAFDDDQVAFTWKDYRQNGAEKIMRLKPDEFIRRFLLHALPDGFHRIRYFGFMANGHCAKNIALCRALVVDEEAKPVNASASPNPVDNDAIDAKRVCPECGGAMRIIERIFCRFSATPCSHAAISMRHVMRLASMGCAMIRLRPRLSARSPSPAMKPYVRGSVKAAKTTAAGLFRCSRRQSSRHKNDQAPFSATPNVADGSALLSRGKS
jgi:Putative transposase